MLDDFILVVYEVASGSVRAETHGMVCATEFRLVLGMSGETSEFRDPVRELTLITVFAHAEFFVGPTEFGLVAGGIDGGGRDGRCRNGGGVRPFQASMLGQVAYEIHQVGCCWS